MKWHRFEIRLPAIENELISLEFLNSYIESAENRIYALVNREINIHSSIGLIQKYENLFLTDKYHEPCDVKQHHFEKILHTTFLRDTNHLHVPNIIIGLRILFYVSGELKHFSDDFFHQILNKLIDLVLTSQEPITTHAIKCLQLFVFNEKRLEKHYCQLNKLLDFLIKNITKYMWVDNDAPLITVQLTSDQVDIYIDDFDRSFGFKNSNLVHINEMDEKELKIPKIDIMDLVDRGIISKAGQQKFHYLVLINCLVKILNPEDIINNQDLFTLIYRCLNVSTTKSDACIAVSLQIVQKLFGNPQSFSKLLADDILYRIITVPCYLSSPYYVFKAFNQISFKNLKKIWEDDQNYLKIMTDYTIRSLTNCIDDEASNVLHKLMMYISFKELNEINAFWKIIHEFQKLEFYKAAKNEQNNDILKNRLLLYKYFFQITTFCEFLQIYFGKYVELIKGKLEKKYKKNKSCVIVNHETCLIMLRWLDIAGYIQKPDQMISNGDLVMGCGESSDRKKCFIWNYDGIQDHNLRVCPCQTLNNISQSQFSHDGKKIIAINLNCNVDAFDVETGTHCLEFINPNRKLYFSGNYPQSNSNNTLILSNGELYCASTGELIYIFNRFEYMQSGIFSVSDTEIIYGQEQWDLRTFRIINQIPTLEQCFLRRTHNDNLYVGYKHELYSLDNDYDYKSSDYVRNFSRLNSLNLIDPHSFNIYYKRKLPMCFNQVGTMKPVDVSRDGSRIVTRKYYTSYEPDYLFVMFEEGNSEEIRIDII
ncbi:Protein VPRBP [Thelohanellus kitauei]|uniref:Protein VPRBP n=1 Tax=Thelohanellus kitauei TaxID=669202 RepID=A0A0C2MH58_THEKT|nr:Protein VPRBP [Thelohanellus kitauei]